jgi:hypothetical protein
MGVHLDLALKDQTNPLVGGKAHVELPISEIWKLIEVENQLMKTLVIAIGGKSYGTREQCSQKLFELTENIRKISLF